uniref:Calponin-homology (CH) domain-containing protein n=1 Tax=Stomoxys calcitrans TaxID=35570 RepID=A0A1I8NW15_STOCA
MGSLPNLHELEQLERKREKRREREMREQLAREASRERERMQHRKNPNVKIDKPTRRCVHDWPTDFCDGTCLCALVENLQTRPLKPAWNRRPANQHHYLENVAIALKSIEADHIKLVNIGNTDIVNGNIKLILGLIWSLIVRYQIERSKFPPRKLMLAWLQAALPECKITNLTTDWNSGVNLAALLDYCKPGLFPHWRSMDPSQSERNCTSAMNLAQSEFGVPKVLEPEYLASPWLDELSCVTYLSHFMKPGGPDYKATTRWVNTQVKDQVQNFTVSYDISKETLLEKH